MTTILILCAAADAEYAAPFGPLLRAEGFATRLINRLSDDGADDLNERVFGLVLWSAASVQSWPVLEAAGKLFAERRLAQVSIDGAEAPPSTYTDVGPVDFSAWRANDRGSLAWRTLQMRLDRLTAADKSDGSHVGAIGSLIAASISIMALSTADRVLEGAPRFDLSPRNHINVADNSTPPQRPGPMAGGPVTADDALDDDTIEIHTPRVLAQIRVSAAPPLPDLETAFAIDAPRIARPSFLRRVLSAAEGLTQLGAPPPS